MKQQNTRVAVIGAGPMGLMATYELLKKGYQVTLFERDKRIGGMSASFDLDGLTIERFYHFICTTDLALFDLLKELEIENTLQWRTTKMGFYYNGKLYAWGDPFSLLRFSGLSLIAKIRYGLHVLYCKRIKNWQALDKKGATVWLKKWIGEKAYKVLWHSLFYYKFYEFQNQLSAAWIASRIRRVARSRKSLLEEQLGYLNGGSDTLLNAIEKKIIAMGGQIVLNADVTEVVSDEQKISGIRLNGSIIPFDAAITTIPLPYIPKLVPGLPLALKEQIQSINNVAVACVVLKLKKPFSNYFWMNVNDERMEIPGIIEYSNLNSATNHVIYVPFYMPQNHPKYQRSNEDFITEVKTYLKNINPKFDPDWILASHVARYGFAQTVCSIDFYKKIPALKTPINNFYMADTSYYYPEDRGISESVAVGTQLANQLDCDFA